MNIWKLLPDHNPAWFEGFKGYRKFIGGKWVKIRHHEDAKITSWYSRRVLKDPELIETVKSWIRDGFVEVIETEEYS